MDPSGTIVLNGGELATTKGEAALRTTIYLADESTIYTDGPYNENGNVTGGGIELLSGLTGDADLRVTGGGELGSLRGQQRVCRQCYRRSLQS